MYRYCEWSATPTVVRTLGRAVLPRLSEPRRDDGDTWHMLADFLPPILSVEVAVAD